ncbi:hypothetical protein BJY52DRAFT_1212716 [Lactarius psammicola]|nr:hypothetical protein BJY52DRAFT_1212716 [Lactarius psammicola]
MFWGRLDTSAPHPRCRIAQTTLLTPWTRSLLQLWNLQEDVQNASDVGAVPLGLTFSFPIEQIALDKGNPLTWTKGFAAKNAVNKDVVGLFQDAFDRKHWHVKCVALVNDQVDITKLGNSPTAAAAGGMLVNTDWDAFDNGRAVLLLKPFDNRAKPRAISSSRSSTPHQPILFRGEVTEHLNKNYGLEMEMLGLFESV